TVNHQLGPKCQASPGTGQRRAQLRVTTFSTGFEAATIERAIAIGEYYTTHGLAAFDLMETDTDSERAQLVLDWIRRTKLTSFKAHELVTARRRAFPTVRSTAAALGLLQVHGYLKATQLPRNGSRGQLPALTYRVHPSPRPDDDAL
ncbi:hypothetical protein ACFY0T_49275, partial [Streptomyces sp. NPDC001530]